MQSRRPIVAAVQRLPKAGPKLLVNRFPYHTGTISDVCPHGDPAMLSLKLGTLSLEKRTHLLNLGLW